MLCNAQDFDAIRSDAAQSASTLDVLWGCSRGAGQSLAKCWPVACQSLARPSACQAIRLLNHPLCPLAALPNRLQSIYCSIYSNKKLSLYGLPQLSSATSSLSGLCQTNSTLQNRFRSFPRSLSLFECSTHLHTHRESGMPRLAPAYHPSDRRASTL